VKRSLDARRKGDIHYVVSAAVKLAGGEARAAARAKSPDVSPYEEYRYDIPAVKTDERPVIAGFGPAGMFAALVLARSGARPIVLERGPDANTRFEKIEAFRRGGAFGSGVQRPVRRGRRRDLFRRQAEHRHTR
jgi:uncharacterized FAD-dependent dehydrogenase